MNPLEPAFEQYRFEVRPIPKAEGGGFLVAIPDLPGCLADGDTFEQAIASARQAFDAWVGASKDMGREVPRPGELAATAKILLRLPKSKHAEVTDAAAAEGVSINTMLTVLIAEALAYRISRNPVVRESSAAYGKSTKKPQSRKRRVNS